MRCTKSALKKRNRTGENSDPCGSLACSSGCGSDVYLLTEILAVQAKQNASIHRTSCNKILLAISLCISFSLQTLLYTLFTLNLTRLSTVFALYAL